MASNTKKAVIQVVLLKLLKLLILHYVRYLSLKDNKSYSISNFLSQSIMAMMVDKCKLLGLYTSTTL